MIASGAAPSSRFRQVESAEGVAEPEGFAANGAHSGAGEPRGWSNRGAVRSARTAAGGPPRSIGLLSTISARSNGADRNDVTNKDFSYAEPERLRDDCDAFIRISLQPESVQ